MIKLKLHALRAHILHLTSRYGRAQMLDLRASDNQLTLTMFENHGKIGLSTSSLFVPCLISSSADGELAPLTISAKRLLALLPARRKKDTLVLDMTPGTHTLTFENETTGETHLLSVNHGLSQLSHENEDGALELALNSQKFASVLKNALPFASKDRARPNMTCCKLTAKHLLAYTHHFIYEHEDLSHAIPDIAALGERELMIQAKDLALARRMLEREPSTMVVQEESVVVCSSTFRLTFPLNQHTSPNLLCLLDQEREEVELTFTHASLHEALQELKEHLTLADQLYLHVSTSGEASALVFGPQRIVTRPVDVKHNLEQDLLVSVCHGYMDKALALLKESHKVTLRLKKGEPEHALMFVQGDSRDTLALMPMRREAAVISYITRSAA